MNITSEDFENEISRVVMTEFGEEMAKFVASGDISMRNAVDIGNVLSYIMAKLEIKLFF